MLIRPAREADLEAVGGLFARAFPDSLAHYFGSAPPAAWVVAEPFRLCLAAEPSGFFVADVAGRVVGYIFAPAQTGRLWRVALFRGFAFAWLWHWLTGRYRIGLTPLRGLFRNKLDFRASAGQPGVAAEARILSLAVDPAFQGQGIATNLCRSALERLDKLGASPVRLEVRPDNRPAVALYTRLGFRTAGVTRDSQGDWLIMLRSNEKGRLLH